MTLVALYIYSRERTRRTKILTRATSDAALGVDHGDFKRVFITRHGRDHGYRTDGTMPRAIAARNTVGQRNAIVFDPHRMADLYRRFFGNGYRQDSTRRTDIRATRTLRTAISAFIRRFRLHESHNVAGRTEHFIRAGYHIFFRLCAPGGTMRVLR